MCARDGRQSSPRVEPSSLSVPVVLLQQVAEQNLRRLCPARHACRRTTSSRLPQYQAVLPHGTGRPRCAAQQSAPWSRQNVMPRFNHGGADARSRLISGGKGYQARALFRRSAAGVWHPVQLTTLNRASLSAVGHSGQAKLTNKAPILSGRGPRGGGGGIRTHEGCHTLPVFETGALGRAMLHLPGPG